MTISGDQSKTFPIAPAGTTNNGRPVTLLERLRRWPGFEMSAADRQEEIESWKAAVNLRHRSGQPRRVLFVHGQLPGETGSGVYMQQIAAEAIRRGFDFHLLSAGYKQLDSSDIRNVPADRIHTCRFTLPGQSPAPGAVRTPISGMSVVMPYPVMAYRDRSEAELLDWLNVFGNHLAGLVAKLQPDVIHVDHLWFLNGLARLIAPWIPLVASCHGTAYKLIVDAPRFRDLVVPCVSSADHVCAISPQTVQECIETFQIPKERITIEGYGFEPELFYYKPVDRDAVLRAVFDKAIAPGAELLVAVGKFVDWKGFKELALAVDRIRSKGRDLTGIIVGEGDAHSRADLEGYIRQLHLSKHLLLPGKVPREMLPDIYRSADLYVLPSHVEPYGMVLMEALACGAPAVFADTGGPPSFVPKSLTDRGLAVMVDPIQLDAVGNASLVDRAVYADKLADGMAAILKKKIKAADRRHIADAMLPLSWGRLVDNLSGIYDRLIGRAFDPKMCTK